MIEDFPIPHPKQIAEAAKAEDEIRAWLAIYELGYEKGYEEGCRDGWDVAHERDAVCH